MSSGDDFAITFIRQARTLLRNTCGRSGWPFSMKLQSSDLREQRSHIYNANAWRSYEVVPSISVDSGLALVMMEDLLVRVAVDAATKYTRLTRVASKNLRTHMIPVRVPVNISNASELRFDFWRSKEHPHPLRRKPGFCCIQLPYNPYVVPSFTGARQNNYFLFPWVGENSDYRGELRRRARQPCLSETNARVEQTPQWKRDVRSFSIEWVDEPLPRQGWRGSDISSIVLKFYVSVKPDITASPSAVAVR
ncbi:hypothetical protein B0H14DRAFT_2616186 [Mycena olivaceomarginata]|nr:hypothetical protein B0H14DRAFT_2616186 [Mycena olivaceomarginata]